MVNKNQVAQELIKCGKDPIYFIMNYVKIVHPLRGVIMFTLYDYQKDLVNKFQNNQYNIILKARQLGASTAIGAYALWMLLFHRGRRVDVIATQRKTAAELVMKSRLMYEELPEWMKQIFPMGSIDNQHEFYLQNGSKMSSHAATSAIRGLASSLLILDEAAFIDRVEEVVRAAMPVLSTGGSCVALSTPNGIGNWFEETWQKSQKNEGSFVPTLLDWRVHPERDDAWYKRTLGNGSVEDFSQEYECSFLASGRTFLDPKILIKLSEKVNQPQYCVGLDGNAWIWKSAEKFTKYYVGVDVSRGDSDDFTTFQILTSDTLEQVFEYQGKMPVDLAAEQAIKYATEYNEATIIVENTGGLGYMFACKVIELGYPNVYFSEKGTHKFVEQHEVSYRDDIVPGISTSSKTRDLILANMEEYIRNDLVIINSKRLYDEFTTFCWNNSKKAEAVKGKHDDLVMSFAMVCWAHGEITKTYEKDMKYDKAILDSIKVNRRRSQNESDIIGVNPDNLSLSVKTGDIISDNRKKIRRKSWVVIS